MMKLQMHAKLQVLHQYNRISKNCFRDCQCANGQSFLILVHRFVNNYTDRVGCGFEFAGIKTQAQRATLRLLDLCNRIRRQVSGIVISKTMYQFFYSHQQPYLLLLRSISKSMPWMGLHINISHLRHAKVQIHLCGGNVGMSQPLLYTLHICSVLQHMRGKRMS